jgi:hypothetical protein
LLSNLHPRSSANGVMLGCSLEEIMAVISIMGIAVVLAGPCIICPSFLSEVGTILKRVSDKGTGIENFHGALFHSFQKV